MYIIVIFLLDICEHVAFNKMLGLEINDQRLAFWMYETHCVYILTEELLYKFCINSYKEVIWHRFYLAFKIIA